MTAYIIIIIIIINIIIIITGGVFLGEISRSIQREMKIGIWKVRSLYRAGSLKVAVGG